MLDSISTSYFTYAEILFSIFEHSDSTYVTFELSTSDSMASTLSYTVPEGIEGTSRRKLGFVISKLGYFGSNATYRSVPTTDLASIRQSWEQATLTLTKVSAVRTSVASTFGAISQIYPKDEGSFSRRITEVQVPELTTHGIPTSCFTTVIFSGSSALSGAKVTRDALPSVLVSSRCPVTLWSRRSKMPSSQGYVWDVAKFFEGTSG